MAHLDWATTPSQVLITFQLLEDISKIHLILVHYIHPVIPWFSWYLDLFMVVQALMLYKLYYEKKVKSLDDPFKKYMPQFSIKDPFNSHEIVLR